MNNETPWSSPTLFCIDKNTGERVELSDAPVSYLSFDDDAELVNIHNSYHFECDIKMKLHDEGVNELLNDYPFLKTARKMADSLNDLIEEYHAPGNTRKERRAVKRKFDKDFALFRRYCAINDINIEFIRLDK